MELQINTIEELTQFIRIFSKSTLEFTPKNENFIDLLYKAIYSGNILPSWLSNSTCQKYVNQLILAHPEEQYLKKFVKGYINDSDTLEMLKPTEHFKIFCGPENLDKDGLINKKMALNFVMYQISMRNVKVIDGTIYMNEYLNSLFNTTLYKIRNDELLDLIDTLFV